MMSVAKIRDAYGDFILSHEKRESEMSPMPPFTISDFEKHVRGQFYKAKHKNSYSCP